MMLARRALIGTLLASPAIIPAGRLMPARTPVLLRPALARVSLWDFSGEGDYQAVHTLVPLTPGVPFSVSDIPHDLPRVRFVTAQWRDGIVRPGGLIVRRRADGSWA